MTRRHPPGAWLALWGIGVVALLVGTFLPWLYSGRIGKNSYQLAGVGQRRLNTPLWVDAMLVLWPYLGPLLAIAAVLLLVRRRRTAGILSAAVGLTSGLVAAAVVVVGARMSSSILSVSHSGPVVTVVGSVAVIAAAVGFFLPRPARRHNSAPIGSNPPYPSA
jgi:hypothetical protein